MRLVGSLSESSLREELAASNAALRAGGGSALRAVLLPLGVDLATALVLDWVPEQSEDIYTVLDGTRRVLTIEVARGAGDRPPAVVAVPFSRFKESIARGSRRERLKLAVAVALLREISGSDA